MKPVKIEDTLHQALKLLSAQIGIPIGQIIKNMTEAEIMSMLKEFKIPYPKSEEETYRKAT